MIDACSSSLQRGALSAVLGLALLASLRSQCELVQFAAGSGFNGGVNEIAAVGSDVYVAGNFSTAAGMSVGAIARFDGSSWDDLNGGLSGLPPWALFPPIPFAHAVAPDRNGDIIVGGQFAMAGGVPANSIARWDGSAWHAMGSGPDYVVHAVVGMPNGDVIAGGSFTAMGGVAANYIARWDGVSWSPLGTGVAGGAIGTNVRELAVTPNGDLIAAGSFSSAGGVPASGIARWDGTSWSALGTISSLLIGDAGLTVMPNGDIFFAASLSLSGAQHRLARWDGTAWTPVAHGGPSWPRSLQSMPNGDLIAMHSPSSGFAQLSRYDGATWSSIIAVNNQVSTIGVSDAGKMYLGGVFSSVGGVSQFYFAALETPCVATVAPLGPGCPSVGGNNVLEAKNKPWAGATFRAQATELPPIAVAAVVTGFAADFTPLTLLLPMTQPNCISLTSGNVIDLAFPIAGSLTTEIDIPNDAALAGHHLYHQVIPFELDAQGNCVAISATNAIDLTVGFF